MYLCNVQHCIYKVHLDTGFSSNTETTINRSDITVFFFFSYVFKMTQKCIFNNIQFKQIIPTTVDTQAKLFKCTMIDLRSRKDPGSPCNSTPGTHWPITCTSFCVLSRSVRSVSHFKYMPTESKSLKLASGKSNTNTPGKSYTNSKQSNFG